jgi:AcrR family transcriptional regulator
MSASPAVNGRAVPSAPRTRLSAVERKAQIIEAARQVFVEQGINGARSRLIAERAGITEAYLYRHFHSKDEIYRLAIDAPLREFVERLQRETHELAQQEGVSRTEVLRRCHELFLACMLDIAPLMAAALFSGSDGSNFYNDFLMPNLRRVFEAIIPDIFGWPAASIEVDVAVQAMLGVHLGFGFEHLLDGQPVDVKQTANEITEMFAPGLTHSSGRSLKATRSPGTKPSRLPSKRSRATKK